MVKDTRQGTVTDAKGQYSLQVTGHQKTLLFKFVGFEPKEVLTGEGGIVNVTLSVSTRQLSDVVVTGYGKSSKRNITGAITTLNPADFNAGVMTSPAQLLQGKVAGLNITKNGDPNSQPAVILRGPSTLRGGDAQEPFYVIDGVPGASIDLVAPGDIVSVDVLKDASSTAIYGARAANGVIMITTRKGRIGQPRLAYNAYIAMEEVSKRIDMLTGNELRDYLKKNGQTVPAENNDSLAQTNWQKEVQRTGISHNHNLSVTGGTESTTYGASMNYLKNEGIIKHSSLERIILKANLEQKFFKDRLKLGIALVNSSTKKNDVPQSALFGNMLTYMPTVNIKRPNGSYTEDFSRGGYLNPVSLLESNVDFTKTNLNLVNALAEVQILPGLQYTLSISSQNQQSNRNVYYNINSGLALNAKGRAGRSTYENTKKIIESYFNYDKTFGQHNVKVLAGYSWQEDHTNDGFGVTTQGFVSDALSYNNLYVSNPGVVGNIAFDNPAISTLRLISYYGRINYQYADKYLLQASLRNDGSSAFGANNQWGYFPAVSAGWRISRENFMRSISFLDELKLRAGYGVSGNSVGFDAFTAILRYGSVGRYYSNGELLTAIGAVQNPNPDLKWESTAMTNIGLDYSFLKGRISGSIDYYIKRTSDLIWDQYPVSTTQYFVPTITANVGTIKNTGIELVLNVVPVQNRNITWTSTLNLANNKNVVESLSNDKFTLSSIPVAYLGGKGQTGNWSQIVKEGLPIGTFNLWHYMGKDKDGKSTFQKADGTVVNTQPLTSDFMIPGNAQPRLTFGWNNSFTIRSFDVNFFLRGVTGNKILNNTLAALNNPADSKYNNIPRFTTGEAYTDNVAYLTSDRFLENGSYIRLDNATIGYTVNTRSSAISKLRFYVSGNNLFVITKYTGIDPEINIGGLTPGIDNRNFYPKTRSFIFGANVIF